MSYSNEERNVKKKRGIFFFHFIYLMQCIDKHNVLSVNNFSFRSVWEIKKKERRKNNYESISQHSVSMCTNELLLLFNTI
jgi:hypothetical protein